MSTANAPVKSPTSHARLLLLPRGLNEAVIRRVRTQPAWQQVKPNSARGGVFYVLICEDCRSRPHESAWVQCFLKSFFETEFGKLRDGTFMPHGGTLEFQCVDLTWSNIDAHLQRCAIFFMCGGDPTR